MKKPLRNLIRIMLLSIFLTGGLLFGSKAQGLAPACSSVFSKEAKEFERPEVLLAFLSEDSAENLAARFDSQPSDQHLKNVAKYYTQEDGHAEINSIAWKHDYRNPKANLVGALTYYLAGGVHEVRKTYAGATFSKEDFAAFKVGEKYNPNYFFSTTKDTKVAERFMNDFGNHHSTKTHVKIFFEIEGRTGRDISPISKFDEAEVLYPPDAEFFVVDSRKIGTDEMGFEIYRVKLSEKLLDPPKLKATDKVLSNKDLKRMQSREIYETKVTKDGTIYSRENREAYLKALLFIEKAAEKRELSIGLLSEIHQIALQGHFFEGFYRRKIRQDYLAGNISQDEAVQKLQQIKSQKDIVNEYLPGSFRMDPSDDFVMTGLNLDSSGHRSFTAEELYQIATDPFFKVEQSSLQKRSDSQNLVDAKVLFLPVGRIQSTIKKLLDEAKVDLNNAKTDYDYVVRVLRLQQNLISIHPFHDGNGRAIKLLSDFLYLKRGIAPPLFANDNDYTLPLNELYRQTVREMKAYLSEGDSQKGRRSGQL